MSEIRIDLKKCPCCGFKAVTCEKKHGKVTYRYRIQCDNAGCKIRTPWLCYLVDAANVWNRREHDEVQAD